MSSEFLSEIRIFSFGFAPKGWAQCNGQIMPMAQNQALFSLLGNVYGGDGKTTFALPDFRGRAGVHMGNRYTLGQNGGEQSHLLTVAEMPIHQHPVNATTNAATSPSPTSNSLLATESQNAYVPGGTPNTAMSPAMIGSMGGSQGHPNMQPYLALNFCIALQGLFPSP